MHAQLVVRRTFAVSGQRSKCFRAGAPTALRGKSAPRYSYFSSSSTSSSTASGPVNAAATKTTSSSRRAHSTFLSPATAAVALASLSIGFVAGQSYNNHYNHDHNHNHVLPNGLPRTCCQDNDDNAQLTDAQRELGGKLRKLVGAENVLSGASLDTQTVAYLKGARLGAGPALYIVTPRRLHEVVQVVQAVVDADCVVLPQGQNTGLTGGSVPHLQNQRPTVVISMKYLNRLFPIDDGKRVVCLAGVGLAQLQQFLQQYFPDRESHSVLGSTFLNPTTAAGIAFGSGGTQCRKGPAYTERALALKITTNKWQERQVEIVDTLGVAGMEATTTDHARQVMDSAAYKVDTWSRWIADGYERSMRYSTDEALQKWSASDAARYVKRICSLNDKTKNEVNRYNADTRGPDWNRSEGKVILLATVHDTFPKPVSTKTFWIGFDSLETALDFRRTVCLDNPNDIPVSMEYMDRDSFDVIDRSGRVLGNTIKLVGTSSSLVRQLWNVKLWIEALPFRAAPTVMDQLLHLVNPIFPGILPSRIAQTGRDMDHHVAMTVGEFGDGNLDRLLGRLERFASDHKDKVVIHECTSSWEEASLTAFRFVAAPAFRTWCVGQGVQGISVDYALPKSGGAAPVLQNNNNESDGEQQQVAAPLKRMRYSHFGCNVVHEDLAYAAGVDVEKAKYALKKTVEHECGGKLPAEHGHGTEYTAPPETQARWKKMDPLNVMNPGVGGTSENFRYID